MVHEAAKNRLGVISKMIDDTNDHLVVVTPVGLRERVEVAQVLLEFVAKDVRSALF